MIEIEIIREHKLLRKLEAKGHASFDIKGKDIVCAAISTLIQNIYIGLYYNKSINMKCITRDGFFCIEVSNLELLEWDEIGKINFLIDTTVESIKMISLSYKNRIKIYNKEVLK